MTLPFRIQSQTEFAAITLAEAKEQCRIVPGFTMDDTYISQLILAAADCAQEYLHWLVSPGVIQLFSPTSGGEDGFFLHGAYITTIAEVKAKNGQNEEVTLTADDYTYNVVTERIILDEDKRNYTDFFVTYNAGATTAQLPHNVKFGMLMMIATMYNNREDFVTGLSVEKMPTSSYKLLKKSRRYVS